MNTEELIKIFKTAGLYTEWTREKASQLTLIDLLVEIGFAKSKSDAKKLIRSGTLKMWSIESKL